MIDDERSDLLVAVAIGVALGVGATLLVRGAPRTERQRLLRELEPLRRGVYRRFSNARADAKHGADRIARAGSSAADSAREALVAFRADVAEIVEDARREILRSAKGAAASKRRSRR
jgi:hypothetical protein